MFLPDALTAELQQFRGANLLQDAYSVPPENGFFNKNVAYVLGQVGTRLGHSAVVNMTDGAIKSMFNWLFVAVGTPVSVIAYYAPSVGLRTLNLSGYTVQTIDATKNAAGASMSQDNERLYAAYYDSNGLGAAGGIVYGWNSGGSPVSDPLFASPVNYTPSISAPATGVITAGTHRFGYLITTRNGYIPVACPNNGTFNYATFTSADSVHDINVIITPSGTWPEYVASVQIMMTTAANLNQWYLVPGASQNVAGGSSTPANITFSISDADLAATGTDGTPYLNVLSSQSGTPPFFPSCIFQYSSRMMYIGIDAAGFPSIWASEPGNFQYITADQNVIYLDGREVPVTGTSLRGVCYVFTKHRTFSMEDNGDVPVSWVPPQVVDNSIGTLSVKGIFTNVKQGFIWVADVNGLYCFQGGMYPPLPVSYYQTPDWQRINWAAAQTVEVLDNQEKKIVMVKAPLDGATTPNYVLCWDYTEGNTPETIKYCGAEQLADGNYNIGCFGVIQNNTTNIQEVWYAPGANGYLIRENNGSEANPYRDVTTNGTPSAYTSTYETSLIPGMTGQRGSTQMFQGMNIRITGSGPVNFTVYSLDHKNSLVPARSPLTLSASPGQQYTLRWMLYSEHESIQISADTLDAYWQLAYIGAAYVAWSPQRG